ncbi:senecionine N-oxygenase-like [Condylostylus longicornis]|uniref:senecionine N-oxygenase-like n=1 Tax=Condylostylus longicornis TaxID=2530218 RepID=UPI00244E5092|nr:senecionine N-oxygenase-like [Condylostylus longicornis]
MKMKVCVIGAGIAGLCSAKTAIQNGMEVVVYEQANEVGGTWVYTDDIGVNEFGIDVHSSMYKGLHTNLPKEIMGYPDFPIPDQEKSYIPASDILKFLNLYADHFNVKEHIKFLHHVIRVRPKANQWEVIVKDLKNDKVNTEFFDFVMVCNGHYHTPVIPNYENKDKYKGKQIHSHDYRFPDPFKGETVLVIGAGPSGMDLANEISLLAKKVVVSHHLPEQPKSKFRNNVIQKPDVLRMTENGVDFIDGTHDDFSIIFYCTGYKYCFPFLSMDCGVRVEDNFVQPLYKHCININNPTMAFIGLPFYVCASQMMDLQARFVCKFFSGQKELPSKKEMLEDTEKEMNERWSRGYKKRQAHMMGAEQINYYNTLSEKAEIENLKPVITKIHNESSQRFIDDLTNFRKEVFRIIDDETFIKIK